MFDGRRQDLALTAKIDAAGPVPKSAEGSLVDKHEIYGPLAQVGGAELQEGAAIVEQCVAQLGQQGLPARPLRLANHQIDIARLAPVPSGVDGVAPYQHPFKSLFAGRLGN